MWLNDEELPTTLRNAVDLLCNHENYVLLAYNNDIFSVEEATCKILKIPSSVFRAGGAMQLALNSSFINIFNKM